MQDEQDIFNFYLYKYTAVMGRCNGLSYGGDVILRIAIKIGAHFPGDIKLYVREDF